MSYENAFKCHDCPESNGKKGCPGWWELSTTNLQTGQPEIQKICYLQALPVLFTELFKITNRPAAAIESLRNEQCRSMDALTQAVVLSGAKRALPLARLTNFEVDAEEQEAEENAGFVL